MSKDEKLKEVHEAYENCKKVFALSSEILEASAKIEDENEYEFYRMVSAFFMQQKQAELIEKGVY